MITVLLFILALLALLAGAVWEAVGIAVFALVVLWVGGRGVGERPRGLRVWWWGGGWRP